MKSCLRSWRQSADTVVSPRRSKVICGRIYDAAICLNRKIAAQVWRPSSKIAGRSSRARRNNLFATAATRSFPVLFVADLFQPVDILESSISWIAKWFNAVDVCRAVPVFLARRKSDHIAWGKGRSVLVLGRFGLHTHGADQRVVKMFGGLLAGFHQAFELFRHGGCRGRAIHPNLPEAVSVSAAQPVFKPGNLDDGLEHVLLQDGRVSVLIQINSGTSVALGREADIK
jgi:hypothetical protein